MLWLAAHDQWTVRRALAQNPNLPPMLFESLCADPDRDVRAAIAAHPHTPEHILERLLLDSDNTVRLELVKRGFGLERLCWEEDDELLVQIPETYLQLRRRLEGGEAVEFAELEPFLDVPLVLRLLPKDIDFNRENALCHESWQVRQAAVRNLHCTVQDLEQLCSDPDRDVRLEVLRHPKVSATIVNTLFRDTDLLVRRAALAHPLLEPSLRQLAQRYILDESLRSSTLNRIVALAQTERVLSSKSAKIGGVSSGANVWRWQVIRTPHAPFSSVWCKMLTVWYDTILQYGWRLNHECHPTCARQPVAPSQQKPVFGNLSTVCDLSPRPQSPDCRYRWARGDL